MTARAVLLCAALVGWSGAGRAQFIVSDPLTEANTLQSLVREAIAAEKRVEMINNQIAQLIQIKNTVAAVSHGNLAALGSLVPELGALGLTMPLGEDMGALARALGGTAASVGATATLTRNLLSTDQFYAPTAADFRAVALNQAAVSAATAKALARASLDSSAQRLTHTTTLRNGLGATADVKAAADATARLAGEQATAQGQANQLLALQILQRAETATSTAREQQAWRCSAESLVARARAAASSANGGTVTLVASNATTGGCASGISPTANFAASDGTGTLTSGSAAAGRVADDGTTLGKMLATSWGQAAADNANALGVNPTALAATCVLESNCRANPGGTGTISGAFQMSNGTYAQTVREVSASNPDLAGQITTKNDPASQSIAAAQYLKDGALSLQASGISNPTVLDVRSYYNFGPAYGAQIASAADNQLMSDVLNGLSTATLRANGIGDATTVGNWRAGVTNRIGAAAAQPVLLGTRA